MSPEQAAQYLASKGLTLSARTVSRYCDAGILRCTTLPSGHRKIPRAELLRLLEESGVSVSAAA